MAKLNPTCFLFDTMRKNPKKFPVWPAGLLFAAALMALASSVRGDIEIKDYIRTGSTPTTHNLTELGALDWVHWGGWEGNARVRGFDEKAGADLLSDFEAMDGGATDYTDLCHEVLE